MLKQQNPDVFKNETFGMRHVSLGLIIALAGLAISVIVFLVELQIGLTLSHQSRIKMIT